MSQLEMGKKIKKHGIIGLILLFTLVGSIVSAIFCIIDGIKILTTKWDDKEIEDSKTLWGILCFVILGNISSIVFGNKVVNKLSSAEKAE